MNIAFPKLTRNRWKGILIAVAIATFVRIMLQPLIPEGPSIAEPSVIAASGLLIPVFVVYAFFTYSVIAYSFVMLEAGLPWSPMKKGLMFGSLFGLVWVAYLYEPVPLAEGISFIDSLGYPLADGLSMLVFGALLGRFVATQPGRDLQDRAWAPLSLLLVPAVMITVRLFAYNVLNIYSSYGNRALETVAWVLVTGLVIGLAYMVLRPGLPSSGPAGRSLAFGWFFYGIPIMLVNFFVFIALMIDVADLALRSILDIVAVIAGVYLTERLTRSEEGRETRSEDGQRAM